MAKVCHRMLTGQEKDLLMALNNPNIMPQGRSHLLTALSCIGEPCSMWSPEHEECWEVLAAQQATEP